MTIKEATEAFAAKMDVIHKAHGSFNSPQPDETMVVKDRRKFFAIDIQGSQCFGAWLVEKATGEIYNIRAYGVPDYNKKQKADLGNVLTADPAIVHAGRWNYLR